MTRQIKDFLDDVNRLFDSSDEEIVKLFNDEGLLGYVTICDNCGRYVINLTDIEIPYDDAESEEAREVNANSPLSISEEDAELVREIMPLCHCHGDESYYEIQMSGLDI
ncbi:MAG: hypothetical protein MJ145_05175 [Clostridia bacterium]|nr:hypothetical protein [Clostridia bacterium]